MTTWLDCTLLEDLLANGVEDWVYEALICGNIARRVVLDPRDRRSVAIGLIAEALINGLVVAGETPPNVGFTAWNCSPIESLQRIVENWSNRSNPDVLPGEIVWLKNTEAGNAIGEAVLARARRGE